MRACPWRITDIGPKFGVFSGFDTLPGWRDVFILSLFLHLIVTVVRLAESVVAAMEADNAFDMSPTRVMT
jgi:hypothetical protein